MAEIPGINHFQAAQVMRTATGYGVSKAGSVETPSSQSPDDSVEISQVATYLQKILEAPDVRQDKVQAVRQSLADGSYDVDARLDEALNRFLDEHSA